MKLRTLELGLITLILVNVDSASPRGTQSASDTRESLPVANCNNHTRDALTCMACNAYFEAGDEPFKGEVAVNRVVLTRVKKEGYPKSVCGVIYQYAQFSWTMDWQGRPDRDKWARAVKAAKQAQAEGPNGSDHYHANYVQPDWAYNCARSQVIGQHIFYNCGGRDASLQVAARQRKRERQDSVASYVPRKKSRYAEYASLDSDYSDYSDDEDDDISALIRSQRGEQRASYSSSYREPPEAFVEYPQWKN